MTEQHPPLSPIPADQKDRVRAVLVAKLADFLRSGNEIIDPLRPLAEYGIDSTDLHRMIDVRNHVFQRGRWHLLLVLRDGGVLALHTRQRAVLNRLRGGGRLIALVDTLAPQIPAGRFHRILAFLATGSGVYFPHAQHRFARTWIFFLD